jgi:hypothetical protein
MRKGLWLAGLLAALGGARPAAAQFSFSSSSPSTAQQATIPGAGQSVVNWVPVTGTNSFTLNPNPLLNPVSQPQQVSYGFRLMNLFPSSGPNISTTPTIGASSYPLQAQMPGRAYLSAFGMHQYGLRQRPWWQWW